MREVSDPLAEAVQLALGHSSAPGDGRGLGRAGPGEGGGDERRASGRGDRCGLR